MFRNAVKTYHADPLTNKLSNFFLYHHAKGPGEQRCNVHVGEGAQT